MKDINKTTCYCGMAGDQRKNMLYCVKCKRWLHEECVKCLDVPMLFGDRFYIFICSVCNSGSECLARLELKWSEVTHLVLYNLSVIHNKTYFDLDASILPFFDENWKKFHFFGPIAEVKRDDQRRKLLDVLLNDGRFKSGREVKKSKNIFGLRERAPPQPPPVEPATAKLNKDVCIWEFHVKERPYQYLTSTKPKNSKDSTKKAKSKKKLPKQDEVPTSSANPLLPPETIKKTKNGIKKPAPIPATFTESVASVGLLDSLIPIPPDFAEENHPFLKHREKRAIMRSSRRQARGDPEQLALGKDPEQPVLVKDPDQPVLEKDPEPLKRKLNGQHPVTQNGNHNHLNGKKSRREVATSSSQSDCEMIFDAKDYFKKGSPHEAQNNGICFMGRRVTCTGKTEYLLHRNK